MSKKPVEIKVPPLKKYRIHAQAVGVMEVTSPNEKEATGFAVGFLKARNPDFRVVASKIEEIKMEPEKEKK